MNCNAVKNLVFRKIDHELSETENRLLDAHMEQCPDCMRAYKLLQIPRRIAQRITPLEPSPFFCGTLKTHIEKEARSVAILQQFFGLARRLIPSMAAITLALLSVFVYLHAQNPQDELHTAYERVFISKGPPLPIMLTEQRNITDASILSAIANSETRQKSDNEPK